MQLKIWDRGVPGIMKRADLVGEQRYILAVFEAMVAGTQKHPSLDRNETEQQQ